MIGTQERVGTVIAPPPAPARPRPRPVIYGRAWTASLVAVDLVVATAALFFADALAGRSDVIATISARNDWATIVIAVAAWLGVFAWIGMYRRSFSTNARDEVYASLAASALAMVPPALIFALVPSLHGIRGPLCVAVLLTAVGVSLVRSAAHLLRAFVFRPASRRIAVVGTPDRVAAVPPDLSLTASDSVMPIAIDGFDDGFADVIATGDVTRLEWLAAAVEAGCDEVIVTEALPPEIMPALLRYVEAKGMKLAFAPMRIRPHACDFDVHRDGGLALLYPRSLPICTPAVEALRRAFDLALAVPALILLSPLFAAVALAVYVDSGAPVLYRQTRVGRHGVEFEILKFRTMRTDAEAETGPVWARSGEGRVTRIGRFLRRRSLDELPQILNVVRGDMSIVGPRPERPFYVEQFRKMLPRYDERHLVKPGITGWSHVHMRRNVDVSAIGERLSYDLFYLEHWSLFIDILIICKTGAEFLFHTAA
jgi:exopolysaccharide biosynthesis polyprenyl glycosylphosphotransferase